MTDIATVLARLGSSEFSAEFGVASTLYVYRRILADQPAYRDLLRTLETDTSARTTVTSFARCLLKVAPQATMTYRADACLAAILSALAQVLSPDAATLACDIAKTPDISSNLYWSARMADSVLKAKQDGASTLFDYGKRQIATFASSWDKHLPVVRSRHPMPSILPLSVSSDSAFAPPIDLHNPPLRVSKHSLLEFQ